jgi:5'-AMP-activated protein kinase catalytic alpha subunit
MSAENNDKSNPIFNNEQTKRSSYKEKPKERDKSIDNVIYEKRNSSSKNIGQFILGEKLGEGTFGKVRLGTHIITGEKVAVKILEKIKILEQADKTRVEREIKILKSLMHNNIIQLYSVIQTVTTIYLIMEYASGKELFDYIVLKKRLSETEACRFYQQIISGIEYLHKLRIVHRDLKPENLLLDHKKDLKIADFGLSNLYNKGEMLKTACGSPCYAAPEMIAGKKYQGVMVDIWSSGIILYAMVCGYLPFEDNNNEVLYKKITDGKFTLPNFLSDQCKDLVRRILTTNPDKRFSIYQIKSHPWFNSGTPSISEGLLIATHIIPIDEELVEKMAEYQFNKEEVRSSIISNRHNHVTTTYYLLLKSKIRKGIPSIADLKSESFLDYLADPVNLLATYNGDMPAIILQRKSSKKVNTFYPSQPEEIQTPTVKKSNSNNLERVKSTNENNSKTSLNNNPLMNTLTEASVDYKSINKVALTEMSIKEPKKITSSKYANIHNQKKENKVTEIKIQRPQTSLNKHIVDKVQTNYNSSKKTTGIKNNTSDKSYNHQNTHTPSTSLTPHSHNTSASKTKAKRHSMDLNSNNANITITKKDGNINDIYLTTEIIDKIQNEIKAIENTSYNSVVKESSYTVSNTASNNSPTKKVIKPNNFGIQEKYAKRPISALVTNNQAANDLKSIQNKLNKKRQANNKNNFFNTSMSFDQNVDAKNTTFDQEIIKKLELEKLNANLDKKILNMNLNVNKITINNVITVNPGVLKTDPGESTSKDINDAQNEASYLERKSINKKFDIIREEDEFKRDHNITMHDRAVSSPRKVIPKKESPKKYQTGTSYQQSQTSRTSNQESGLKSVMNTSSKSNEYSNTVYITTQPKHHKNISEPNAHKFITPSLTPNPILTSQNVSKFVSKIAKSPKGSNIISLFTQMKPSLQKVPLPGSQKKTEISFSSNNRVLNTDISTPVNQINDNILLTQGNNLQRNEKKKNSLNNNNSIENEG